MNYQALGEEYLWEAERLHARMHLLRCEAASCAQEKEADKLAGRIRLLYDMYRDCRSIGEYLIRCGEQR